MRQDERISQFCDELQLKSIKLSCDTLAQAAAKRRKIFDSYFE